MAIFLSYMNGRETGGVVSEIFTFNDQSFFPRIGQPDRLYISLADELIFFWNGTEYRSPSQGGGPSFQAFGELSYVPTNAPLVANNTSYSQWVSNEFGFADNTEDGGNNDVLISNGGSGFYKAAFHISYEVSGGSDTTWAVFVNGVISEKIKCVDRAQNGNDWKTNSAQGYLELNEGDVVDVRVISSVATLEIYISAANLTLLKVGNTTTNNSNNAFSYTFPFNLA